MKKLKLLFFIPLILFNYHCQKIMSPLSIQTNDPEYKNYFKAMVINQGIDCGDTYLIKFIENLEEVEKQTEDQSEIYYADKLSEEFKINNLHLLIKFRNPTEDELYPCTMLGPTYPHIVVLEAKRI